MSAPVEPNPDGNQKEFNQKTRDYLVRLWNDIQGKKVKPTLPVKIGTPRITGSDAAPGNPNKYDIWSGPSGLKQWNGSSWI